MQEANITQQLADVNQTFRNLFLSVSEEQVNTVPFKDSWTPAQVARHVFKAEAGMMKALETPASETGRDAFAAVPELKHIFLDFTTKLKSPEMAVPEQKEYNKEELIRQLDGIATKLTEVIPHINNKELVTGLPAGDLTKGEIIHFLLYHTLRHIHQLEHIIETLSDTAKATAATHERIVRLVNEAFIQNDMPLFLSYCADDIEWNMIGDRILTGKDAILKAMTGKPGEGTDSTVDSMITEDNKTVGTGRFNMINKEGVKEFYQYCDIYTFRDDKITSMNSYVVAVKS